MSKKQKQPKELRPRDRFITLRGDPINLNPVTETLTSDLTKAAGIVTAFDAVSGKMVGETPEQILVDALQTLGYAAFQVVLSRLVLEKYALAEIKMGPMSLIESEALKTLCIDKSPDPAAVVTSMKKYGESARATRIEYGVFSSLLLLGEAYQAGQSLINGDMSGAYNNFVLLTGSISGLHRFNKVAKGEWAIVDMPSKEKVAQMQDDYDRRYKGVSNLIPGFS